MSELELARAIVAKIAPTHNPETSCMLVASAVAGMRRLTMRNIRIGALFWPAKFKDEPMLSMRGGWGCEGYDRNSGRLYLADDYADPDEGSFSGHTWLEPWNGQVIDLMHEHDGDREIYDADFKLAARYIPRMKLERSVKAFWRPQMTAAITAGKEVANERTT